MDMPVVPEWLNHSQYLVAFFTGFLGGVHCFGMCGSIVGALTLGIPRDKTRHSPFIITLGYNIGRISGYVLAGTIVAFVSSSFIDLADINGLKRIIAMVASLFMIALGLYLAGIWNGIAKIEILGGFLWKRIQPLTKRFMPVTTFQRAIPLGFLWGWLPCGMVYMALMLTMSVEHAFEGGLIMLAFGLGTLPNLLVMGVAAAKLSKWVRHPTIRMVAGLLVVLLGVMGLWQRF